MPPRTLHGLDRDVYQIVRKFEDEHERENSSNPPRFTVSGVYDWIKKSNSSLARQKRRPLEDSIHRVLRLRKEERLEDDEEADLEDTGVDENSPRPKVRTAQLLISVSKQSSPTYHWLGARLFSHEQAAC